MGSSHPRYYLVILSLFGLLSKFLPFSVRLNVQQRRREKYWSLHNIRQFSARMKSTHRPNLYLREKTAEFLVQTRCRSVRRPPSSCTSPWHWPTRPWSPTTSTSTKWRASYKQPSWPTDTFPSRPWRAWFSMESSTARSSTSWARRTTSPIRSFCWGRPLALADASFANWWLISAILQE